MNTDFRTAYLKSLNLIKQDDEKKDEECKKPCQCEGEGDDQKADDEKADDTSDTNDNGKVINDDVDEDEVKDDDAETSDDSDEGQDKEDGEEQGDEEPATCFCFKTTNQTLIDAINSGFDKVVFTVKAKDDEGNDTTTDVEFTNEDFADFEECDECEDEADDESDDVTDDDLADDIADLGDEDGEGSDDDFDDEDMSFESVFKRYYGSLVSENK